MLYNNVLFICVCCCLEKYVGKFIGALSCEASSAVQWGSQIVYLFSACLFSFCLFQLCGSSLCLIRFVIYSCYPGDNIGLLVAVLVYKLLLKQKFMLSMLINVVFSFQFPYYRIVDLVLKNGNRVQKICHYPQFFYSFVYVATFFPLGKWDHFIYFSEIDAYSLLFLDFHSPSHNSNWKASAEFCLLLLSERQISENYSRCFTTFCGTEVIVSDACKCVIHCRTLTCRYIALFSLLVKADIAIYGLMIHLSVLFYANWGT